MHQLVVAGLSGRANSGYPGTSQQLTRQDLIGDAASEIGDVSLAEMERGASAHVLGKRAHEHTTVVRRDV